VLSALADSFDSPPVIVALPSSITGRARR